MNIQKKCKEENNFITISKSFYDLTNIINKNMLVYPGDPKPEFLPISTIKENDVNVSKIVLGSHTGTHVDAPIHFEVNGDGISEILLNTFVGNAIVLDMSKKIKHISNNCNGVTFADFERYSHFVKKDDIVLLYTGSNDSSRQDEDISKNFSYIEPSGADWIIDHHVKCIGIDSFSVEKYNFDEPLTHKKLLSKKIGIIENLNPKLKKLIGKRVYLVCTPLPLEGLDGSPARVLAFDIVQ